MTKYKFSILIEIILFGLFIYITFLDNILLHNMLFVLLMINTLIANYLYQSKDREIDKSRYLLVCFIELIIFIISVVLVVVLSKLVGFEEANILVIMFALLLKDIIRYFIKKRIFSFEY